MIHVQSAVIAASATKPQPKRPLPEQRRGSTSGANSTSSHNVSLVLPPLEQNDKARPGDKSLKLPRRRHEPAKLNRGDGRASLRGVQSTSDLERYAAGVDM